MEDPILVTGAHRTGTTWVGRLLAADPHVSYISEPLNVLHRPGVFGARVLHWYTYVCRENEGDYLPAFLELLAHRYHLSAELKALRSARDVARMARDVAIFAGGRLRAQRVLLKDPFAVFSLVWFAERLLASIVVTVRHPAAFVSSLKRLNWSFDFQELLRQPLLMRDYLEPYRGLMQSELARDLVGQASVLWTMVYGTLSVVQNRLPSIQVVVHEDLSRNPADGFRKLYDVLALDYTERAHRAILDSSGSQNPVELSPRTVHAVKLDSLANLDNWRHRLSESEIARVREITGPVAQRYYAQESWN